MTFEVCAREWLERQNFIKSTRKWARQGLEIYAYPVIGDKELKEITEVDIDQIFVQDVMVWYTWREGNVLRIIGGRKLRNMIDV